MNSVGVWIPAALCVVAFATELDWGPSGPARRLASPDETKVLYEVPYQPGRNDSRQLLGPAPRSGPQTARRSM